MSQNDNNSSSPAPLKNALLAYAPNNLPTDQSKAEYIGLVKNQLIQGKGKGNSITDAELVYFLQVCQSSGLNPITRQVYAIFRGGKMTIQTGIDGLRAIAERTGNYAGSDAGHFEYDEDGRPIRCTITVSKIVQGNIFKVTASAKWSEYAVTSNPMWNKMPETMLEKCAEAKALRKAFPNIGQIYVDEEMEQAENKPIVTEQDIPKQDLKKIESDVEQLVGEALKEKEKGEA